jgi:hypothetical protein
LFTEKSVDVSAESFLSIGFSVKRRKISKQVLLQRPIVVVISLMEITRVFATVFGVE